MGESPALAENLVIPSLTHTPPGKTPGIIDVQYLQNVVFSIENSSNGQNHSLSDSHHQITRQKPPYPHNNISHLSHQEDSPYPVMLFEKPWLPT